MYCKICGMWSGELHYCSEECRNVAVKEADAQRVEKGEKYKDSLDQTLDYCKRIGLSYGEYQKLRTLGKIGAK